MLHASSVLASHPSSTNGGRFPQRPRLCSSLSRKLQITSQHHQVKLCDNSSFKALQNVERGQLGPGATEVEEARWLREAPEEGGHRKAAAEGGGGPELTRWPGRCRTAEAAKLLGEPAGAGSAGQIERTPRGSRCPFRIRKETAPLFFLRKRVSSFSVPLNICPSF